jgi:hypothetical protein
VDHGKHNGKEKGARMEFQVTVRYGEERQRYHLFQVSAPDLAGALGEAADSLPEEISRTGDLVEIRPAVDPESRSYLDEGPGPGGGGPAGLEPDPEPPSHAVDPSRRDPGGKA